MKKYFNLLLPLVLLSHVQSAASAATTTSLPIGSWLIGTQMQWQLTPKAGVVPIPQKPIAGTEIATYYSDHAYFSTEWFNKQKLYLTDSIQPYLRVLDAFGQWTSNKSAYTMTYDPYALSVSTTSGKNSLSAFLTRLDYVDVLAKSQNTIPIIDSVRMLSYIDNGQVLSKGKKLKGKKQMMLLVKWHDDVLTNQQATLSITENYTAVPYTLTSTCCGDDTAKNATDSEAFLKNVEALPGINKTASGLRFLVLQEGKGTSPVATDKVQVNYRGYFPSGVSFDSNTLISFSLNGVIAGWTEGLQLMKPGAKYRFFIPSNLAYGATGNATIKGNSALVFDVELIGVVAP